MAKFEEVKDGVIFPSGAKNEAYAQYFVGQSYLEHFSCRPLGQCWRWECNF